MHIAGMRVRITIQKNETVTDRYGNHKNAWTDYFKCWATASNQTGKENDEGSKIDENFKDLAKLEKSYKGKTEEGEELQIEDLEIFENVAYIMAYHADHSIPGTIDEWLDQFEMFSIYEVLPEILELWGTNLITDVESKKNMSGRRGK